MMTYNQYLHIMYAMESFYDFHPEYFAMLTDEERSAMSRAFLYDYDDHYDNDDHYPPSVEKFFYTEILPNEELLERALAGWAHIFQLSQMGEFKLEEVPDTHP